MEITTKTGCIYKNEDILASSKHIIFVEKDFNEFLKACVDEFVQETNNVSKIGAFFGKRDKAMARALVADVAYLSHCVYLGGYMLLIKQLEDSEDAGQFRLYGNFLSDSEVFDEYFPKNGVTVENSMVYHYFMLSAVNYLFERSEEIKDKVKEVEKLYGFNITNKYVLDYLHSSRGYTEPIKY